MTSNSLNCPVFVLNHYSLAACFAGVSFCHCIPTRRFFRWLEGFVLPFVGRQRVCLAGDKDKTQEKKAS